MYGTPTDGPRLLGNLGMACPARAEGSRSGRSSLRTGEPFTLAKDHRKARRNERLTRRSQKTSGNGAQPSGEPWCNESCKPGSGRSGWKRVRKDNALAAYSTLTYAWHPVVLALKTMRSLVCSEGIVPPMEELLPSAPLLLPSFRCYLSSSLLDAYSTFSGEYQCSG